ncbi:MAG: undecaprenyldiphospho-muramoylpentapeptide beta-N-acetylglucosaminyltransferase [Simkaniaceae bacterium]|nr:MAG: undecaprenyldiphospho-muramoylpentapeptide beta-N-acetylglucosaminyltransferase [Simkaniaceae bacterium]
MDETGRGLNIIIAAGGTGGHLFPAQALALELIQKHPDIRITFIGAGLKKNPYFKKDLFPFVDIQSGTPFRKQPLHIIKALLKISQGIANCFKFMGKKKPDLIVGFGSYHTFPAIYAAKLKKIPIIIFESNALPGRVNRFCSKWAKVSAIQFSHASEYLKSKSVCVQMPLLKKEEGVSKKEARAYFGLEEEKLTFLIFGGSQGAQSINRFICGALEPLIQNGIQFQVIHIVGNPERAGKLEEVYKKNQISASVKVFEEKMEYAWAAADLNISRAGSATLAELIEFTVPSILIPYPFGTENHQSKNAAFVTDEIKGAVTLEEKGLRGVILAEAIMRLLDNDREILKEMKGALRSFKEEENKQDLCSVVLKTL